jgi:hypothetical protein
VLIDTNLSPTPSLLKMADNKYTNALAAQPEDIKLLLAAQAHIGAKNCDKSMENYVWKRRSDGEWRRRIGGDPGE